MRNKFEEQLERLHVELIQMGALCEDGISAAAEALLQNNPGLAQTAIDAEREIDQKEREVENLCIKLLLQQQPVAKDLREISAALKMISDLELARAVYTADDKVDALFDQVKQELIGMIAKDASRGEQCMDLLMVAKYLERIGDHATNVAEWVEYSITGNHPSNN